MKLSTVAMSGVGHTRWTSCLIPAVGNHQEGQAYRLTSDHVAVIGKTVGQNLQRCHVYGEYGAPSVGLFGDEVGLDWLSGELPEPPVVFVTVTLDGIQHAAHLPWTLVEHDNVYCRHSALYRIPDTLIVLEAFADTWMDSPVSELRIRATASNPDVPESVAFIDNISVSCDQLLFPRWSKYRDIHGGYPMLTVMHSDQMADGQSQTWVFECVNRNVDADEIHDVVGATQGPAYSMCADWRYRQAWGPFRQTPQYFGDDKSEREATLAEHGRWVDMQFYPGSRWSAPIKGLALRPGQTGDQHDFGVS